MKPIHKYASQGDIYNLKMLLDSGASIDEPESRYQMTPLHIAIMKNHREVIKLLLDYDANIYATDIDNRTSLDIAASLLSDAEELHKINNLIEIIKLLLSKEIEIRKQGRYSNATFLKDTKNKFNLIPISYLNDRPHLKKKINLLFKNAEKQLAQGILINSTDSTSKIISEFRNRKPDVSSLGKHVSLELENSQNTDPNSSAPSKDSWLPSVFQSIFGSSSASEEREALLNHEKRSPKTQH